MLNELKDIYRKNEWQITSGILSTVAIILKIKDYLSWKVFFALLAAALIIPIAIKLLSKSKKKRTFGSETFMIEFLTSTGVIGSKKKVYSEGLDKAHKLSSLSKTFKINGADCQTEKLIQGTVISNELSHGLNIYSTGGSSTSSESLGISCFDKSKSSIQTYPTVVKNEERKKIIQLPFNTPKSKGENFIIQYKEEHWFGAMRKDYDGIYFDEHVYYNEGIDSGEINVIFEKSEVEDVCAYVYNNEKDTLTKDKDCSVQSIDKLNYTWRRTHFDKNEIYIVMYKYFEPII